MLCFYAAGPLIGSLSGVTQANVPAAALGVVCPTIAAVAVAVAVAVAARTRTSKELLARVTARPRGVLYGVTAVVALPVVVMLSVVLTGQGGDIEVPGVGALVLVAVYVVGSLAEEIGWTAFLLPRLLRATGATRSALIIGVLCGRCGTSSRTPRQGTRPGGSWVSARSPSRSVSCLSG